MDRVRWAGPAALLAAVLLGYANSFSGAFQFDDFNVIVDNPSVHSLSSWLDGASKGLRPLLKLTYALNWTSGLGLFGFHLFNGTIHAANTCLVYLLSRRLIPGGKDAPGAAAETGPFLAALLFAVHPVQTEAVTYISGRSMSLMAFFYLGSLSAYARGVETNGRTLLWLVSPALFLLALLTRETAVTLPAALLLWESVTGGGRTRWPEIARRQAAHWMLLSCALAFFLVHPAYRNTWGAAFASQDPWRSVLAQVQGAAYLLSRLAMVHRLNIDPDLPVPQGLTPAIAAEGLLLLSLLAAGIAARRKAPVAGFGILWFFLHLLPTNSIIPRLDIASERHLYLAGWGIFLAVGAGAGKLSAAGGRKGSRVPASKWVPAAAVLAAILMGGYTIARNRSYRSEVALWESTVRLSPAKARAHNNLGYAYQLSGMREKAIASYREALRLDEGFRKARGNLATLSEDP
ncbi:MAG: Tetratricopeptide 2 repeat protein [Deltaproteobacteria bacterium]|nr:Tetratricopeptide 2 repeat protein [Deltaproteobacteria bacterium]